MKGIGLEESTKVMEYTKLQMVLLMMAIGLLESIMALELLHGLMVAYTEENGKTVEKMEKANSLELMVLLMKANGLMESTMAREL